MIAEGILISLLCNSLCVFPRSHNIPLTLDAYPDMPLPPLPGMIEQHKRQPQRQLQAPATSRHKRTITIPGYAPQFPVPSYWRAKGKGWEIGR